MPECLDKIRYLTSMQLMAHLFHPVLHAAHLLESKLRDELVDSVLQPRQARLLDAIDRYGPATQASLSRLFAVAPASMSVMLARLERDGLITRQMQAGAHRNDVGLTDLGRAALPAVAAAWNATDAALRHALGPEGAEQFSRSALQLRDALGGSGPPEIHARSAAVP